MRRQAPARHAPSVAVGGRLLALVALTSLVVLPGGCGDSEQVAAVPRVVWTLDVGRPILSSPAVVDSRVYFGADDYAVHCVDAATGEEQWKFLTQDVIEAPALVVDGKVFIGSSDFFFYALDAQSGELLWKYETEDRIVGGANVHRSAGQLRILVGSYDSNLYCFDAASGERLWKYGTSNYVNGTPAIDGGRAVFGGCDAVLHVVDIATGEATAQVELGPGCHVPGSVALADGRAYLGHYGNEFICMDLATEAVVWSYGDGREPFFSSPAIGADRGVFGGRDRFLHCVGREDGALLWKFATSRKVDGSPLIVGDEVVFGGADGRLYVVGLADGVERWSYDIGRDIAAAPAFANGMLFVGGTDGVLYAFGE